jgi:hypothetical protein
MATTLPDYTGEALERLLDVLLERQRRGQQAAQFNAQLSQNAEQFAQTQALDQQRVDLGRQAQGLAVANAMIPFVPEGATFESVPWLKPVMGAALGVDPDQAPELQGFVFNKETLQSRLRPLLIQRFESLPEEDRTRLMEGGLSQMLFGDPSQTVDRLNLGDRVTEVQGQGVEAVATDPEVQQDVGRTAVGLQPTVEAMGQEFKNPASAELAVALLNLRQRQHEFSETIAQNNTALTATSSQNMQAAMNEAADVLIKQANEQGVNLGRGAALAVVQASYQPGQLERLLEQYPEGPQRQAMNLVAQIATGAVSDGQTAVRLQLQNTPGGDAMLNSMNLGQSLEAILGKDQVGPTLEGATRYLQGAGAPFAPFNNEGGLFRGNQGFQPPPPPPRNPNAPVVDPGGLGDPREEAAARMLSEGTATAEQVRQQFRDSTAIRRITNRSTAINAQRRRTQQQPARP